MEKTTKRYQPKEFALAILKCLLLITAFAVAIALSSCAKEGLGGSVGIQAGPVYIQIPFGNTASGPYYGYGNVPSNVNASVVYIIARPSDQTAITVFDQNGRQMGIVTCTGGDWRYYNDYFLFLRNWNYNAKPCPVLAQWDQKFTNAWWTGHL